MEEQQILNEETTEPKLISLRAQLKRVIKQLSLDGAGGGNKKSL